MPGRSGVDAIRILQLNFSIRLSLSLPLSLYVGPVFDLHVNRNVFFLLKNCPRRDLLGWPDDDFVIQ